MVAVNAFIELLWSLRKLHIVVSAVFQGGKEGDAFSSLGCAVGSRCWGL